MSLVRKLDDLSFSKLADNESKLSGRYNKLSKANNINNNIPVDQLYNKPNCSKLYSEDTRFLNPIDNYRSMSLIAYQYTPYLITNPSDMYQDLSEKKGISSRILSKDNSKFLK